MFEKAKDQKQLCILKETNVCCVYLKSVIRIFQNEDEMQVRNHAGDELFLRYETVMHFKNKESNSIYERVLLHCMPERIALKSGGSYDAYAYETRSEECVYFNGEQIIGKMKPETYWKSAGFSGEPGADNEAELVENYYQLNEEDFPVIIEQIE